MDGIRHLIGIGAIQSVSDADACWDETVLVVGGRQVRIPAPLDSVAARIDAPRQQGRERWGTKGRSR